MVSVSIISIIFLGLAGREVRDPGSGGGTQAVTSPRNRSRIQRESGRTNMVLRMDQHGKHREDQHDDVERNITQVWNRSIMPMSKDENGNEKKHLGKKTGDRAAGSQHDEYKINDITTECISKTVDL